MKALDKTKWKLMLLIGYKNAMNRYHDKYIESENKFRKACEELAKETCPPKGTLSCNLKKCDEKQCPKCWIKYFEEER